MIEYTEKKINAAERARARIAGNPHHPELPLIDADLAAMRSQLEVLRAASETAPLPTEPVGFNVELGEPKLTRVEQLRDQEILSIAKVIGAGFVPVVNEPAGYMSRRYSHSIVHKATGVRIDFSGSGVLINLDKPIDSVQPQWSLLAQREEEGVTFWGREQHYPGNRIHDIGLPVGLFATGITFTQTEHTGFFIKPYGEIDPVVAEAFGPWPSY